MNSFLTLVSYTLAAMAGICFVGGLAEKTYYRRYLTERILTLRGVSAYGNDDQERGG